MDRDKNKGLLKALLAETDIGKLPGMSVEVLEWLCEALGVDPIDMLTLDFSQIDLAEYDRQRRERDG